MRRLRPLRPIAIACALLCCRAAHADPETLRRDLLMALEETARQNHYEAVSSAIEIAGKAIRVHERDPGGTWDEREDKRARRFRAGAVANQFSAVALLVLVEQQQIRLDTPLRAVFPDCHARLGAVTVRELLSGSSRLPDVAAGSSSSSPESRASFIEMVNEAAGNGADRASPPFSRTEEWMMGAIVEEVSGQAYRAFIDDHVLNPAALTNKRWSKPNQDGVQAPSGRGPTFSSASLMTTAADLLRFRRALRSGELVRHGVYALMCTPHAFSASGPAPNGFGQAIASDQWIKRFEIGGVRSGVESHLVEFPDFDTTVAVVAETNENLPYFRDALVETVRSSRPGQAFDLIIANGTVIDGTGTPGIQADVGISEGRIAAVGALAGARAGRRLDATNLVVTPGFVDVHNHSAPAIASRADRFNEAFLRQGVTTIVGGADGEFSPNIMTRFINAYETNGVGTNVAFYVGFNGIRQQVLGMNQQRAPSAPELARMQRLVCEGMEMGALGLSTGLMYTGGMFAETGEVVSLAAEVAPYGGIYDSHVRDPVHNLLESDREAIEIGAQAGIPTKIAHLKGVGLHNKGVIVSVIGMVEEARARGLNVVSDQYPYDGAKTAPLREVIILPPDVQAGSHEDLLGLLEDDKTRESIRVATENGVNGGFSWMKATGYNAIRIVHSEDYPEYLGRYLIQIADDLSVSPFDALVHLLQHAESLVLVTLGGIDEEDVRALMVQPWNMIASDGQYVAQSNDEDTGHPRNTGTFPRFLGHYVRERELLPLEEAVRKISSFPADSVGLTRRGRIALNAPADIAVFDPETIRAESTWRYPNRMAAGVKHVLVNGVPVLLEGELTEHTPGQVLRLRNAETIAP